MIGWALRQLVIWGGVALLIFAVGNRLVPRPAVSPPAPTASAPVPIEARGAVPNSLVFRANPQGHVVVEAEINGAPVKFLVDTGATMVVLTLKDAAAAGLSGSDLVFSMRTSTANGVARAAPVTLRELRIDQLVVRDVTAAVAENLNISLLGQSFLTRLDGYEMRDGVLTLNYW
ncbi:MAG: TIGR02281 family clan AA aspartic protease [Alphaproteobacteria bacterium]